MKYLTIALKKLASTWGLSSILLLFSMSSAMALTITPMNSLTTPFLVSTSQTLQYKIVNNAPAQKNFTLTTGTVSPANLTVAAPSTCNGGSLPAGGSCTWSVTVTANAVGTSTITGLGVVGGPSVAPITATITAP